MKVLKGCSLVLMSFILFVLLVIFGFAYTVNHVALNPHYIVKVLNDIDFSQAIRETINEQSGNQQMSVELQNALVDTFDQMEPVIKARVGIALEDTYAYLKGKGNTPNLKGTLSDSVMNSQFVADLLDKVDLSQLVSQELKNQKRDRDRNRPLRRLSERFGNHYRQVRTFIEKAGCGGIRPYL